MSLCLHVFSTVALCRHSVPYGLLTHQEEPVPLKSSSVNLSICECVAGVSVTLNYENKEKVPLEVFFVFPVDEDSAVYDFEAMYLEGKISQAFKEDKCSRDICCNVENLYPGSKAALTLKYVQELPLEADEALNYVLPAILNPWYQLSGEYLLSLSTGGGEHNWGNLLKILGVLKSMGRENITQATFCRMAQGQLTPIIPLEDLPHTLSMVATISSQHSNCPLSPTEYLGDDKTAVLMQGPMSKQDKSQPRIEAAKEALILLQKSLPIGSYFNVYGFGSCYEPFFHRSVKYTQCTMDKAQRRVKLVQADLEGMEILTPLRNICHPGPSILGHPLQIKTETELTEREKICSRIHNGEVTDTFSVIKEVQIYSLRHSVYQDTFSLESSNLKLLSFLTFQSSVLYLTFASRGEGIADARLISLEPPSSPSSWPRNCYYLGSLMISKIIENVLFSGFLLAWNKLALRALKWSLQPVVEDICRSWDLPFVLSAKMLSPEQTVIFRSQRLIIHAQLTGIMPFDANLIIHHLAAESFLQTKDMGFRETPAKDKKDVLKVSTDCGVISSHTAFIAVNKDLNDLVRGSLVHRDIPRPILLSATVVIP
ncbi:von Willebrand factor A domain-containing protein 5A [Pteropus alecto]|uniref:von Willebrand factor A domain-containing protein 5A n=1 Tax=Pteropus alecto TaxID=9402 RepID=L5KND4_PTEAL|nr:von Willebrand factor A domain-containing protein 5A [Pteropus alecto]